MIFSDLMGRRVLVVEDDFLQASILISALQAQGSDIIGPYPDIARGIIALENAAIDAAVLDVLLGTELVFSLADLLVDRNIPFMFVTGCDERMIPGRFRNVRSLRKPLDVDEMAVMLAITIAEHVTKH
jgi:DNA-binding response OmpR family regulator